MRINFDTSFLKIHLDLDRLQINFGHIGLVLLVLGLGVNDRTATPPLILLSAPFIVLFARDPYSKHTISLRAIDVVMPGITAAQRAKGRAERQRQRDDEARRQAASDHVSEPDGERAAANDALDRPRPIIAS